MGSCRFAGAASGHGLLPISDPRPRVAPERTLGFVIRTHFGVNSEDFDLVLTSTLNALRLALREALRIRRFGSVRSGCGVGSRLELGWLCTGLGPGISMRS